MGIFPNPAQQEAVQGVENIPLWRATLEHWKLHGWSLRNVVGILELYQRGGPSACRCKQSRTSAVNFSLPLYQPQDPALTELIRQELSR